MVKHKQNLNFCVFSNEIKFLSVKIKKKNETKRHLEYQKKVVNISLVCYFTNPNMIKLK